MAHLSSGDKLKFGPNWNNMAGWKMFHKIHPDLSKYKHWNLVQMTWTQPTLALGGDLRLYPVTLPAATLTVPHITRCGLDEFLDFINFNGFDCLVTARLWKKNVGFRNYNGIFSYVPPEDQRETPSEVFDAVFTISQLKELA